MNIFTRTIPLSALLTLAFGLTPLLAQANSAGSIVAVLDVGKVFRDHVGFNQRMEDIKKEIQAFEADINRQRQGLSNESKALQQYKAGSPEYKQLETTLAQKTSDLQLRMQLKRKELLEREAQLYYQTYQQIVAAVARIAEQNKISLVVRYDSDEIDPTDRMKVLKGVNRFVVVQQKLDLTGLVLQQVNPAQARRN